jgi:hypothetical protein
MNLVPVYTADRAWLSGLGVPLGKKLLKVCLAASGGVLTAASQPGQVFCDQNADGRSAFSRFHASRMVNVVGNGDGDIFHSLTVAVRDGLVNRLAAARSRRVWDKKVQNFWSAFWRIGT